MSDGDEVRNLLGRYCERMDAADWAGIGALFEYGALTDEHGTLLAEGAPAVAAFYEAGTRLHDGSPRTKHLVLDTVLEDVATDGSLTARSSYVVLQALEGFALQPIITGRYLDRFWRGPSGAGPWRFAERRFLVDLLGDLSHHLRYEL